MTEEWIRWISAGILGWIVWELRQLRAEVAYKVHYRDCDKRMAAIDDDIDRLEKDVGDNRERIAALEAKQKGNGK